MDWSIITDRLACGGTPDESGVAGLLRHDYTHVIDLRHTTIDSDLYWMNFAYLRNPTIDDGETKPPAWFHRSIWFAWGALLNPASKVYIGCHSGLNRAPSTLYAILLSQGWAPNVAMNKILSERPDCTVRYSEDASLAVQMLRKAILPGFGRT